MATASVPLSNSLLIVLVLFWHVGQRCRSFAPQAQHMAQEGDKDNAARTGHRPRVHIWLWCVDREPPHKWLADTDPNLNGVHRRATSFQVVQPLALGVWCLGHSFEASSSLGMFSGCSLQPKCGASKILRGEGSGHRFNV